MVVKKVSEPSVEDLISAPVPVVPVAPVTPVAPVAAPLPIYSQRPVMVNRPAFRKPFRRPMGRPMPQRSYNQNQPFTGMVDNRVIPDADMPTEEVTGMLELAGDHGVLRQDFAPGGKDIYISASQIRRFMLRGGDEVEGMGRPPKESERYFGLLKVVKVNGVDAEKQKARIKFEDLIPSDFAIL